MSQNVIESSIICSNGLYNINKQNINNYRNSIQTYFDPEYMEDHEYEKIVKEEDNSNIHHLVPKLFKTTGSFLSMLDDDFVCYTNKDISMEYDEYFESLSSTYTIERENRYILKPADLYIPKNEINSIIERNFILLASDYLDGEIKLKSSYSTLPSLSINYSYKNPFTNLENFFKNSQYRFLFFIKRDDNLKTLVNYFDDNNISYSVIENMNIIPNKINILRSDINEGFIDNNKKIVYVSSNDLFGLVKTRLTSNESIKAALIDNLSDLKVNDFIVHQEHGIGKYKGLITMNVEKKIVELIKIEYADKNNLYMPITSMALIQRYIGTTGLSTRLSQLGTDKWLKIKQRAKKKIEDIAAELLRVQAKRELKKGYKFKLDNQSYERFCSLFPYVETDDQLESINNVIDDMCSDKTMDRVICGDVGFGKTEVILRASFVSVNNKKQVALIVPTTVLAKQHFQTFRKRFSNYKYTIEMLTRATSKSHRSNIIENINNNKTHIIIGTHALLSSDFKYRNLGLLVIDEEHKFGVKHKESIKSIRENIDVLTLTATPIPRTLNSTLSEIKDMSIINTPPIGRKNIETDIIDKSEDVINTYIKREMNRGGQLLYIHNEIETMDNEIDFLSGLCETYIIEKIHGKLHAREIERIMNSFLNEEINILVCTSIIESGLDMTNVNTIIINDAQNFGLSQLHQIRGRVGRSNRQAYAGLIISNPKYLTKEADKRLNAFIKTSSLAGGLEIAGHDLDIRGAGEILGEEQSGQIFEIGYGMYTSMLSRAISHLKNRKEEIIESHTEIDSYISALIPQDYIEDIFLRLELYNDISNTKNDSDINYIITRLEDIYGVIPDHLNNLLNITRVRIAANHIKAEKIKINKDYTHITLNSESLIDNEKLVNDFILDNKIRLLDEFNLRYRNSSEGSFEELCNEIILILKQLSN